MSESLRILLRTDDPVRRQGLAAMLEAAGHVLVDRDPGRGALRPRPRRRTTAPRPTRPASADRRTDAGRPARRGIAARCHRAATRRRTARRRRGPDRAHARRLRRDGFRGANDDAPPLLTPREAEILTLVGQGMSNKSAARALGISVHTVKFHLEALFAKLDATSRAEAVAKGLRGGVIEL